MSNTKHTPGPWVIDKSNPVKIQGIGHQPQIRYPVCSVSALGKHWQANARLMAAAPELLDACILAEASDSFTRLNSAAQNAIRAAIAKATGTNA
jgi:hypothetical protein